MNVCGPVAVAVAVAGGWWWWCVCVCVCVFHHGLYWGFWAWVSLLVAFVSCLFRVCFCVVVFKAVRVTAKTETDKDTEKRRRKRKRKEEKETREENSLDSVDRVVHGRS